MAAETGVTPGIVKPEEVSIENPNANIPDPNTSDPTAALDTFPVLSQDEFSQMYQPGMKFADTTANDINMTIVPGQQDVRSNVVSYAKSFLGTPYVWGGAQPGGFDCSGLVQFVAAKYGLHLPRLASQQATAGKNVGHDLSQLRPGDLIVWSDGTHVAMYAGNGQIVEAPHRGTQVRVRALGKDEAYFGVQLKYPGENDSYSGRSTPVHSLGNEAASNARAIIKVGRQMGASPRDIQIALMTAMTESSMHNVGYGDKAGPDSRGLFQQRNSWGPASVRMDPAGASRLFYRELFKVKNRNNLTPWQAAQAVQRSAFSDGSNYATNWNQGQYFFTQYGG